MLSMLLSLAAVVAAVAALAAVLELRTAWRFARAPQLRGVVEADDGALLSPLTRKTCVVFSLVLTRRQLEDRSGASLQFLEQRPFSVRTADRSWRVDKKGGPVAFVGLDVIDKPLPFLPQAVLGLLVQRFGHLGHLWAQDQVITAREAVLADGADVHLFIEANRVRTISPTPLATLAQAAFQRSVRAAVVSALLAAAWLLFH